MLRKSLWRTLNAKRCFPFSPYFSAMAGVMSESERLRSRYSFALLPVLQSQLLLLQQENAEFLAEFEQTAKETMQDLLKQSKERIETTHVHYGIPTEQELSSALSLGLGIPGDEALIAVRENPSDSLNADWHRTLARDT